MYTLEDQYRYKNVGGEIAKVIKRNEGAGGGSLNILNEGSAIFRSSNFMRYRVFSLTWLGFLATLLSAILVSQERMRELAIVFIA